MAKGTKVTRKKGNYSNVDVHISSSSNNTIMSAFYQKTRSVIAWSSTGVVGFKGSRKSTPHAAQAAAEDLSNKMVNLGVKNISVVLKGLGSGRESAVKTFQSRNFQIDSIEDRTSFPHNGVKMPRRRRV